MEELKTRIVNVLKELFDKHFESPARNWPSETHNAIVAVKHDILDRIEAELERGWNELRGRVTAPAGQKPEESK